TGVAIQITVLATIRLDIAELAPARPLPDHAPEAFLEPARHHGVPERADRLGGKTEAGATRPNLTGHWQRADGQCLHQPQSLAIPDPFGGARFAIAVVQ